MILKFNILKLKFKILLLRTFGTTNLNIPTLELNQQGHNSKDILIIFPHDEEAFRVAVYTFEDLLKKDENSSYYFIINTLNQNMHSFYNNTIVVDFNKNISNQISPRNKRHILNGSFDIIVDLNTAFNYNCSKFVNTISSKLKIGFKSSFSDLFYNIQLDASSSNVIENLYKKIYSMVLPV